MTSTSSDGSSVITLQFALDLNIDVAEQRRFQVTLAVGVGEPEEIGELVLFMCSDACPFMTADTVYVNGGGGWR